MRTYPILTAFLAMVLFASLADPFSHASGWFFRNSPEARIIRKAARFDLVPVSEAVPGSVIDMRYKITSASGKPLYVQDMPCLIHVETGKKLHAAQRELERQGYGLKVWDAWRPPEAHIALWEAVRDPRYVVPPEKGLSWHCYGISVDVTLVKKDGRGGLVEVQMPTRFDVFTPAASSHYTGGDTEVKRHLDMLQTAMDNAGFRRINDEWWHFDDAETARQRVYQVTAERLGIELPE